MGSHFDKLITLLLYCKDELDCVYFYCDQKTYYVGISSNLEKRLLLHKNKYNRATAEFSDIKLINKEEYQTGTRAKIRENILKVGQS